MADKIERINCRLPTTGFDVCFSKGQQIAPNN